MLDLFGGEPQRARSRAILPSVTTTSCADADDGPNPCSETNSGPIIASATAPANTAFLMQSLQFEFVIGGAR